MPKNMVLAAKYRDAVQRVLMKKWSTVELKDITSQRALEIFTLCTENRELKSKAASVLVQLLQWGADNGHCDQPQFSYSIANEERNPLPTQQNPIIKTGKPPVAVKPQEPLAKREASLAAGAETAEKKEPKLVRVKPQALAKRKAELAARAETTEKKEHKNNIAMEQEKAIKRGRAPRPIAQIDPHTFEVVKVWDTMKDAERTLGASGIFRAVRLLQKSAGFYWIDAEEAGTFKDRMISKMQAGVMSVQNVQAEKKGLLDKFKEEQQECEQMKQSGNAVVVKPAPALEPGGQQKRNAARDALEVFTDDELIEELDRRGWQGEIRKIQIVSIGVK